MVVYVFPWVSRTMCASPTVAVGLHPRLCYATPTGFHNFFRHTVGSAHDVRVTHVCVMSPPRGSVLCHRDAVRMFFPFIRGFRA